MEAPRNRLRLMALAVLALAGVGLTAYFVLRPPAAPPPLPEIDWNGVDPRIAHVVRDAEDRVREAPESGTAWGKLGQVLLANEFYPQAQICLARAEELDPGNPRWPYLQARMDAATNPLTEPKLRRAIERCDKETAPGPILHLAEWLLSRGRIDEAEAEFRRSLELAPNNPWGRIGTAKVALARGDAKAARIALEPPGVPPTARDVTPRYYYAVLAEIEQRLDHPEAAAAAARLSRTLRQDPDPPDLFSAEVVVLTAGLRGETIRANAYLRDGRVDEAVALLEQLAREFPENHTTWLHLAPARLAAGDAAGAEAAARRAVQLAPDSTAAHTMLGNVLTQAKKLDIAAAAYRKAVECQPGNPTGYLTLADALDRAGDTAGGETALRDGLRHAPQHAALHRALGERLLRVGKKKDAQPYLRDAVRLNPDDEKAASLLKEAEKP